MNAVLKKLSERISTYKWLLIPGIPLIFFIVLLVYITTPQPTSVEVNQTQIAQPTVYPTAFQSEKITIPSVTPEANTPFFYGHGADIDEPVETRRDFLTKEALSSDVIKYELTSANPSRPNIMILQGDEIIFTRELTDEDLGITLDDYLTIYGQPSEILKAPKIYGAVAVTYFYAKDGTAIVTNTATNTVFESHIFPPMKSSDYMDRFQEYIQ